MALTYEQYRDFVEALREHPDWRAELRPLILGEDLMALPDAGRRTDQHLDALTAIVADLATKVGELAEAQKRTEARLEELAEAQKRTETRLEELAEAQKRTEDRLDDVIVSINGLNGRVSQLEGSMLESKYHHQLASYLGDYLRRPRAISPYDLPLLMEASDRGDLAKHELQRIRLLDVLAIGDDPATREETVLACELSYTVNMEDVERAATAAATLRRAGYRTRAYVAGYRIRDVARERAAELQVEVELHRPPPVETALV
ncbi:MAG: hypothetical protein ACKVT1_15580 [Dehalococcoidia bacterium]